MDQTGLAKGKSDFREEAFLIRTLKAPKVSLDTVKVGGKTSSFHRHEFVKRAGHPLATISTDGQARFAKPRWCFSSGYISATICRLLGQVVIPYVDREISEVSLGESVRPACQLAEFQTICCPTGLDHKNQSLQARIDDVLP